MTPATPAPKTDLRTRMVRVMGARVTGARDGRNPASALAELPDAIAARLSKPLAERLARLQPQLRFDRPSARASDNAIAERVGGRVIGPQLIRVDRVVPMPTRHGAVTLDRPPTIDRVASARLAAPVGVDASELLLFDTETSGLAGGTGTIAFVVGLLRWSGSRLQLTQFLLLGYHAEGALLDALGEFAAATKLLVSYNGKTFDTPLLRTRYGLQRRTDPFEDHAHLDLLHWVRRMRPRSWSDARLATVESQWLGLTRSGDMSGAEVPAAWQRWLQAGDASAFAGILSHNRLDLLSLAAILQRALFDRPDDLLLRAEATMTKLAHWTSRTARLHPPSRASTAAGLG